MTKSKRLLELMMMVNRKRKFTVKELADEFHVSTRTILRDLQELSELGVPLYSEVGPHGGYQVLNERILPPIAFTEGEAISMFFASHALRHFSSLPFETESNAALNKFYHSMSGDIRDQIDQMKNRFDFLTPTRQVETPFLSILLEGAVHQKVIHIEYEVGAETSCRTIQPVGIYAINGLWYCPAYCLLRDDFRLFRCDRIHSAAADVSGVKPLDLRHVHLRNWESFRKAKSETFRFLVELSEAGVQKCESEIWAAPKLSVHNDGTGKLEGEIPKSEIQYAAKFFIGLGSEATVIHPAELVTCMKRLLSELMSKYSDLS